MHFDAAENWADMHDHNKVHLLTVFKHEALHVFDIGHSETYGALMYPSYDGPVEGFHADDLAGIADRIAPVKRAICGDIEQVQTVKITWFRRCLLYTSPSPRDQRGSRMPSSA